MSFVIPDIPSEVKTQIQREKLLAKEAKFEHGLTRAAARDGEYEDLIAAIRDNNNASRMGTLY